MKDHSHTRMPTNSSFLKTVERRALLEDSRDLQETSTEAAVLRAYEKTGLESLHRRYENEKVGQVRKAIYELNESEALKKSIFEGFPKSSTNVMERWIVRTSAPRAPSQ